jgi:hypothetical protein
MAERTRRAGHRAAVLHHRRPHPRAVVVGAAVRGEGVPLNIIQRQVGDANLGTTSIYLQGIDPEEIITAVRTRQRR